MTISIWSITIDVSEPFSLPAAGACDASAIDGSTGTSSGAGSARFVAVTFAASDAGSGEGAGMTGCGSP